MTDLHITGFDLIEKLGEGGMATVWKARQISLDRIVAIKILSPLFASEQSDVNRFLEEARQAARLKHSGIVQVYDARAEEGIYYFVMEHIAGYTIGSWLRRKGKLSVKESLIVAECIADALDYAWTTEGMIHCDIKPDNVMIDSDGTVKVADLGLSRSIGSLGVESDPDHVLGTPAYISPEQAIGGDVLDCRADIYSLGAMLYHMVTGRPLFHGMSEDRVMDMQVNGCAEDPCESGSEVPPCFSWLIEKMLAKNRGDRQSDWKDVRVDLERVKRGYPPRDVLPAGCASTVARGKLRSRGAAVGGARKKGGGRAALVSVSIVLFAVLVLGIYLFNRKDEVHAKRRLEAPAEVVEPPKVTAVESAKPDSTGQEDKKDETVREAFEFARQWAQDNPERYDEAARRFEWAAMQAKDTKYERMAMRSAELVRNKKKEAVASLLSRLNEMAWSVTATQGHAEAVAMLENYDGKLAVETEHERLEIAARIKADGRKKAAEEAARKEAANEMFEGVVNEMCESVVKGEVGKAAGIIRDAILNSDLGDKRGVLEIFGSELTAAAEMDERILETFIDDVGKEIEVALADGNRRLRVSGVSHGKVRGEIVIRYGGGTATRAVSFAVDDLSVEERMRRMKIAGGAGVDLLKGAMASEACAWEQAERYFGGLSPELAEPLRRKVIQRRNRIAGESARKELENTLNSVGVINGAYSHEKALNALENGDFSAIERELADSAASFRERHGDCEFRREAEPVLQAMESVGRESRRIAVRAVGGMQAGAEKPNPVAEKLVNDILDLNPLVTRDDIVIGFDSAGGIVSVEIVSEGLKDIGPVGEVNQIEQLAFGALPPGRTDDGSRKCAVESLESVRGLPLLHLDVGGSCIKSLEPLRTMNLQSLRVRNSPVADIESIEDMDLCELVLHNTMVKDITPIEGMPLEAFELLDGRVYEFKHLSRLKLNRLVLRDTQFRDLRLIDPEKLMHLDISRTRVRDFSPLKLMNPRVLVLAGTQIKDLSVISHMRLQILDIADTSVSDIFPLKGMELSGFFASETNVRDFSVLKGMPLKRLSLRGSEAVDIDFLAGAPLEHLDISDTRISDLAPLSGAPIEHLNVASTKVSDISCLRDAPLVSFDCRSAEVTDFSPLVRTPLRRIRLDEGRSDEVDRVLRSVPRLENVNGQEF